MRVVLEAECSFLTKLIQQHMLNEKTRWMIQISLLKRRLQLKIISYVVYFCLGKMLFYWSVDQYLADMDGVVLSDVLQD